jgi:hypothetical protein
MIVGKTVCGDFSRQVFGFVDGTCAESVFIRKARHILAENERFTRERKARYDLVVDW